MLRKILIILLLIGCSIEYSFSQTSTMETFVNNLLSKMTLDEKLGQLNLPVTGDIITGSAFSSEIGKQIAEGKVGGLFNLKSVEKIKAIQQIAVDKSRLKIPLLFGMDVIHGYETIFPIPLGLSCTWDMKLIERTAQIAAIEASADGINWTFSPMVDISRDPRWGRVAEGSGEDPYLGAAVAKAMVKGYQGDLNSNTNILACVKHFALYGASEAGRDYNTTDMSRNRMYNEYFLPYKAAVDAGVASVMAAFNDVDGIPATGNKWLLTDVLRKQWGFKGFVVSDYTGISEMQNHGFGDLQKSSALALNAGVEMDMVSGGYLNTLKKSLKENKITEEQINRACKLILIYKYKLGLFDDPYKYCDINRAITDIFTTENLQEARTISAKSFVLLKNSNKILPLKKKSKIALIGPLAFNKENMNGTWSVAADKTKSITLLDGMRTVFGDETTILYAKGCNLFASEEIENRSTMFGKTLNRDNRSEQELLNEAIEIANNADVIVYAGGEAAEMSGESSSFANIDLPDVQKRLLLALKALGKPIVFVLFNGRPMTLNWEKENLDAILDVWFPGSVAGLAIADALIGNVIPSGKLTATFPRSVGQIPIYYAHKNTGRPLSGKWFQKFQSNYIDVPNDPLFPFGFGLSYTQFDYSNLQLNKTSLDKNSTIEATITVKNIGDYDGEEIIQLYIHQNERSITPPVKELKGFKKVFLKKGESIQVSFEISEPMLRFYNQNLEFVSEKGTFEVMIGKNSDEFFKTNFILN